MKKGAGIGFILAGILFGILGLAWSQVVFSVFAFIFNGHCSGRHAGYGTSRQMRDIGGVSAVCAIMAVAVLAVLPHLDQRALLRLSAVAAVGGVVYIGLSLALRLGGFKEAQAVPRGALGRRA